MSYKINQKYRRIKEKRKENKCNTNIKKFSFKMEMYLKVKLEVRN
jgi:hypothetical protein